MTARSLQEVDAELSFSPETSTSRSWQPTGARRSASSVVVFQRIDSAFDDRNSAAVTTHRATLGDRCSALDCVDHATEQPVGLLTYTYNCTYSTGSRSKNCTHRVQYSLFVQPFKTRKNCPRSKIYVRPAALPRQRLSRATPRASSR